MRPDWLKGWTRQVGALRQRFSVDHDQIVMKEDQPGRDRQMDGIRKIRDEGLVRRDLEFGRWVLSIPEADWNGLVLRNPDLNSTDAATKDRALRKFLSSPLSIPYRVQSLQGSGHFRPRSVGGLKDAGQTHQQLQQHDLQDAAQIPAGAGLLRGAPRESSERSAGDQPAHLGES